MTIFIPRYSALSALGETSDDAALTSAEHERLVEDARGVGHAEGKAEGMKQGVAQGAADTMARFSEIVTLPEAQGRELQAAAMWRSGVSIEAARSFLRTTPPVRSLADRIVAEHGTTVGGPSAPAAPGAKAASGWCRAVMQANNAIGAPDGSDHQNGQR